MQYLPNDYSRSGYFPGQIKNFSIIWKKEIEDEVDNVCDDIKNICATENKDQILLALGNIGLLLFDTKSKENIKQETIFHSNYNQIVRYKDIIVKTGSMSTVLIDQKTAKQSQTWLENYTQPFTYNNYFIQTTSKTFRLGNLDKKNKVVVQVNLLEQPDYFDDKGTQYQTPILKNETVWLLLSNHLNGIQLDSGEQTLFPIPSPHTPMVEYNNAVYFSGTDHFYGISLENGKIVLEIPVTKPTSIPVRKDHLLYFHCDNEVVIVDLNTHKLQTIFKVEFNYPKKYATIQNLFLLDQQLIIQEKNQLVLVQLDDPKYPVQRIPFENRIDCIQPVGDAIYVGVGTELISIV